jgi:hypothetical protein
MVLIGGARLMCDQLHTSAAVCFTIQHIVDYCWAPEEVWRMETLTAHTAIERKFLRLSERTVTTVPTERSGTPRAFLNCLECDNDVITSLSELNLL